MSISSSNLLLLLTTGNLLLAAPVNNFCGKTKNPGRCVELLKSTDERTPTAAAPLLEYIAIEAAQVTGDVKMVVEEVRAASKDPYVKTVCRNCENSYLDALDALNQAQEYLKKAIYGNLVATSGIIGRVADGCAAAVAKNPGFKGGIDDTLVLGQLIGIIARFLSHQ